MNMSSTTYQVTNFIGGAECASASAEERPIVAPATGEVIGTMAWSGSADVAAAVEAAARAARGWADLGMPERRRRLEAWGAALRAQEADIAMADAIDTGTPIRAMRTGIGKGLDYLHYFAGLWSEVKGETIPATSGNLHFTLREPFGPVGIIIPFNHPAMFALSKAVPALIAGNCVVLKPSELTPISAHLIAKASAGILPAGVFNVVHGGPEVGQAIVASRKLHRVHFTGGVPTGLAVQRGAAESGLVKHVSLELGGKNPLVVFPDVDPSTAAQAAFVGMNYTRNQGQSCGSTSRLFVHADIAKAVVDEICEIVSRVKVGLPQDETSEMGSLVSSAHQQRVLSAIEDGRRDGAQLLVGGTAASGELARGAYVLPTVFAGVAPDMALAQREIFGPVLSVIDWTDAADMLERVNGTDYGLTAAIYTNDLAKAMAMARDVEAGYVWVNGVETRWPGTPFGGYKNSGSGSEHSLEEILSYTRTKTINIVLPSS
jgi:acyl-CoA reductase-like NAD-dependent aldehyde dehydrogenase